MSMYVSAYNAQTEHFAFWHSDTLLYFYFSNMLNTDFAALKCRDNNCGFSAKTLKTFEGNRKLRRQENVSFL